MATDLLDQYLDLFIELGDVIGDTCLHRVAEERLICVGLTTLTFKP